MQRVLHLKRTTRGVTKDVESPVKKQRERDYYEKLLRNLCVYYDYIYAELYLNFCIDFLYGAGRIISLLISCGLLVALN